MENEQNEKQGEDKPKSEKKAKTVRMKRDPEMYSAPHTADVHPDEVQNFREAGWEPA